jgi:hypothetical protein
MRWTRLFAWGHWLALALMASFFTQKSQAATVDARKVMILNDQHLGIFRCLLAGTAESWVLLGARQGEHSVDALRRGLLHQLISVT